MHTKELDLFFSTSNLKSVFNDVAVSWWYLAKFLLHWYLITLNQCYQLNKKEYYLHFSKKSKKIFNQTKKCWRTSYLFITFIVILNDNQSQFLFLKSNFVILGQQKRPILVSCSKTNIPVGVSPNEYSEPSLPKTVCMSTPYISRFLALFKNCDSAWAGDNPLQKKKD